MKKISAEEYREARKKFLARLSPEEIKEIERKKLETEAEYKKWREEFIEQHKEMFKWLNDGMEANKHHEKAIRVLLEALRTAANHKDMTPEIKENVEALINIVQARKLFEYNLEAIMNPLIEIVEKDTKSKSGSHAVNIRHKKFKAENKAREEEIREIWASGKYSTRDICAEEEYNGLGFSSFKSARKALTNTPNPEYWDAKQINT